MHTELIQAGRNSELAGRLWMRDEFPLAVVIVVHGLGDHSGRYDTFACHATKAKVAVFAFDLPGHGLSPGRRGHFDRYDDVLRDLHAARVTVASRFPNVPQFILGHSMGGNLVINYELRRSTFDETNAGRLIGVVLAAPMLLPPNPPARPQIFAAWITGLLFPWIKFRRKPNHPKKQDATEHSDSRPIDPLLHSEITIYLATQLLAQGRWALDHARSVDIPTLIIDCEDDPEIDRAASQNVAIRIGENATHIALPSGGHNLLHDSHDSNAIQRTIDWIIEQTHR